MKVLVTGGAGYVGSHTVRELLAARHDVVVYDNLSTGHREASRAFPGCRRHRGPCPFAQGSSRSGCGDAFRGVRLRGRVDRESTQILSQQRRVRSSADRAVLASNVRLFVFSSSCATYGVPQRLPVEESSPKDPINPYGVTKLFLEQVLSAYRYAHGLQHVCLRYFNAAGAHPSGEIGEYHDPETHLIPLALKAVLGTAPALKVFGRDLPTPDGTCIRDFVHVSDLGRAHVKALDYLANGGESIALNLGAGGELRSAAYLMR